MSVLHIFTNEFSLMASIFRFRANKLMISDWMYPQESDLVHLKMSSVFEILLSSIIRKLGPSSPPYQNKNRIRLYGYPHYSRTIFPGTGSKYSIEFIEHDFGRFRSAWRHHDVLRKLSKLTICGYEKILKY